MTPKQASQLIGCTPGQVRHLVKTGRLKARIVEDILYGRHYDIHVNEVRRYRDEAQRGGFPRGGKRQGPRGPQGTVEN